MVKLRSFAIMICCSLTFTGVAIPSFGGENVLRVVFHTDPTNIDPRYGMDVHSERVVQLVSNGLLQKDPQLNLIPCLAEKWENPDDRTYTFYLRKGVQFHDGSELTAEDVKYTFESILAPEMNSPHATAYTMLQRIDILDPYTIKFTLTERFAPFLSEMTMPIVPKKAAEALEGKRFTNTLIGTGPFKLVEWRHDERLVFEANPNYFEGAPKLDGIIFKIIPDYTVRFLELQRGDVDFAQDVIPSDMIPIAKETKGLKVISLESGIIYFLGFDLKHPILSNVKVRQAIAYAIDRQAMIEHLWNGRASPATGLLSPSNWAYEPNVRTYNFDPERAKSLLDEAGYPDPDGDGPEPRFKIVYKTSTTHSSVRVAEVVQAQLKKVGIEISEIQIFEWAKYFADILSGNFQMYFLACVGISEPDIFHSTYHSSQTPPNGRNRGFYSNAKIDELTERGRSVIDIEERKRIYSEIQQILAEEVPEIYLWHSYTIIVMNEKVHGFTPYPDGNFVSFKDVWIEE